LVLFCQFPQIVLAASCDKWLSIMARPSKVISADVGVLSEMRKKYTRAIMVCYPLVQEIRIVCIPHP